MGVIPDDERKHKDAAYDPQEKQMKDAVQAARAEQAQGRTGQVVDPNNGVDRRAPVPTKDSWAHRSYGMQCRTCMFFVPKATISALTPIGRCRRHAPTMNGYPVVYLSDWCGDHKLDETKTI